MKKFAPSAILFFVTMWVGLAFAQISGPPTPDRGDEAVPLTILGIDQSGNGTTLVNTGTPQPDTEGLKVNVLNDPPVLSQPTPAIAEPTVDWNKIIVNVVLGIFGILGALGAWAVRHVSGVFGERHKQEVQAFLEDVVLTRMLAKAQVATGKALADLNTADIQKQLNWAFTTFNKWLRSKGFDADKLLTSAQITVAQNNLGGPVPQFAPETAQAKMPIVSAPIVATPPGNQAGFGRASLVAVLLGISVMLSGITLSSCAPMLHVMGVTQTATEKASAQELPYVRVAAGALQVAGARYAAADLHVQGLLSDAEYDIATKIIDEADKAVEAAGSAVKAAGGDAGAKLALMDVALTSVARWSMQQSQR